MREVKFRKLNSLMTREKHLRLSSDHRFLQDVLKIENLHMEISFSKTLVHLNIQMHPAIVPNT